MTWRDKVKRQCTEAACSLRWLKCGKKIINGCKLKGANELLPNELNYEKRNTQVQVGGEGGADIRIVNCFVSDFLSFSL